MLWGVLTLLLLVANLATAPLARLDPVLGVLALAAVALESLAVRLPAFGAFSASPACLLPLVFLPHGSGGLAALVALFALVVRSVTRGPSGWWVDAISILLAGLTGNLSLGLTGPVELVSIGRGFLVVAVYLASHQVLNRLGASRLPRVQHLPWLRLQSVVWEMRSLVSLAALGLARASEAGPWLGLALLPLWGAHRAVGYGVFRLHSKEASQALAELDKLQRGLERVHREEDQARRELQATREEKLLLEQLTGSLSSQPDLHQACQTVLDVCARVGHFQSLALFDRQGACLARRSPLAAKIDNAALLGLREAILELAMGENRPQIFREIGSQARLFEGEEAALAVPFELGVLYAGRTQPPLSEGECRALMWVMARSGPLLTSLGERVRQRQDLQETREQSQLLAGQVSALSGLLQASRMLASSLEAERLLELGEEALQALVPHSGGSIWLKAGQATRTWGSAPPASAAEIVRNVVRSGRPLQLEGCLGAPLVSTSGAVLLVSLPTGEFSRDDLDALSLLCSNLGLALANANHLRRALEAQAQLIQSAKMTAVGQLAAGVAHELNTPLGAISLALESAALRSEENVRKKLERAGRSADRCRQIVEKLLVYTRLGSPVQETVIFEVLVQDTLDFFRSHLELEGYELAFELQSDVQATAQAQELQQVLISLLLNAKEACATSECKKIVIRCGREDGQAWLQVRDWGVGMTEEELGRAFEPFYTTKTIGTNIGLGLSVALEIARQHGGELTLQSAPGQGTAATLKVPAARR